MEFSLKKLKSGFSGEKFCSGINIGSSTVKFIKLKCAKNKVELSGFGIEPIGTDLGAALKRMTEAESIKTANTSLSGSSTVIRYVSFPKMEKDELREALKFEAEKHIPFPLTEVNIDSHILKDNLPDNKMFVLLAAAKKEAVNKAMAIFSSAGIRLDAIDIDSLALINAFNFNYSDDEAIKAKTFALLNIGALESNLNILDNDGVPVLSRDVHIGSNNFTQKISDTLNVDLKTAEGFKLGSDLGSDKEKSDKVTGAIESVVSGLGREIRTSFDYYESQHAASIAKIFLSGGGSIFAGFKEMLSTLLGIEVQYWDPLRRIAIPESVDSEKVKTLCAQFTVAIGLALRQ